MKFTTAIHDNAYKIVSSYAEVREKEIEIIFLYEIYISLFKKGVGEGTSYKNVCKLVKPEKFTDCLIELCRVRLHLQLLLFCNFVD